MKGSMEREERRVKRAVILAAGRGTRLAPLTDICPKPLVEVAGRSFLTTLLEALRGAQIPSITIVRGYRAEAFEGIRKEYPEVSFLENPDWEQANNISSIVMAGRAGLLEDCYVLEGDLYLADPSLVTQTQSRSNYLTVPVPRTEDWYFDTDPSGKITSIGVGSDHPSHQMVGISYWTAEDGARLAQRAEELYRQEQYRQLYWDEIALRYYPEEFSVYTRPCRREAVWEIDTVAELSALEARLIENRKLGGTAL